MEISIKSITPLYSILSSKLLRAPIIIRDMGNIAITSFVDLHQLSKTTAFGRTLGETFFNELFIRGFNVADFRGQNALTVNTTGEFFITRNAKLINKNIPNTYVLVGTYSSIDNKNSTAIITESDHFDRTLIVTLFSNSDESVCEILSYLQNFGWEKNYERIQILSKTNLPTFNLLEKMNISESNKEKLISFGAFLMGRNK